MLTDPAAYGGRDEDAFEVIVPSIPGFGFSEAPHRQGINIFITFLQSGFPPYSQENTSSDTVQPPLPRLDLPVSEFSENREESQTAESLCTDDTALEAPDAQNAQCTPYAPGTHKSTHVNFGKPAKSFSDFYL